MRSAYPIIMTKTETGIIVFIPDFNINTQGDDISDAMEMARDAIGIVGIDLEDDNVAFPTASDIKKIQSEASPDSIISYVDIDFSEYRRKNELRCVRKNCTIPAWLNYEAEQAGLNFSAILQAALKEKLNISDDYKKQD